MIYVSGVVQNNNINLYNKSAASRPIDHANVWREMQYQFLTPLFEKGSEEGGPA